jgi:hypothetical protein
VTERRQALLVTSSVYNDSELHKLAGPQTDAKVLAAVLKNARIGGFDVQRLTNPTAARASEAVETFFTGRQWDDVLLLYFSGHGVKNDRGDLFFAMKNTRRNALRSTSLPASFVRDVMSDSQSQRQILLLDCCYGGAFARRLTMGADSIDVKEELQGYGTVVLTASTALEFSWQDGRTDGTPKPSVFTGVIAEGLRNGEADVDGDGNVTVADLHRYASKRIRALGVAQTPTLSTVGQEGELVIGHATRRARPVAPARTASGLDLSQFATIRNSGQEGSVVGMAIASAMEIALAVGGRPEELSARYGYEKSRVLDSSEEERTTFEGATIQSALKVATKFGLPLDEAWRYTSGNRELPKGATWKSMDAKRPRFRAEVHPISKFEEIPYYLARGCPIVTGLAVYGNSWFTEDATKTGWIELPEDRQLIGGHAVVIVGFDGPRDALKFANSWGKGWGDGGFGYMSRAAVEKALNVSDKRAPKYWAFEVPLDAEHCLE